MKLYAWITVLSLSALAASTPQDPPAKEISAQHRWLKQFVGEWTVTSEATMEPGADPISFESTEVVRAIGDLWIVGEMNAVMGGEKFTALLTLGYDSNQSAFVGTWIDTMQSHLWSYRGSWDEKTNRLALLAKGPHFGDPTKTAEYRDEFELASPDHKILRSSVHNEDGTWTTFMTAHYHRKK